MEPTSKETNTCYPNFDNSYYKVLSNHINPELEYNNIKNILGSDCSSLNYLSVRSDRMSNLNFTYHALSTKNYILNRSEKKRLYCFLYFVHPLKKIHEKAVDLISTNARSIEFLFLIASKYDEKSSINQIPQDVIKSILNIKYLELINFYKFHKNYSIDYFKEAISDPYISKDLFAQHKKNANLTWLTQPELPEY